MKKLPPLLLLFSILFVSSVFIINKKELVSKSEKRTLATWPEFSINNYTSGLFFANISLYINDHFPLRSSMVDIAQKIRYHMGFHLDKEERIIVITTPKKELNPKASSDSVIKKFDDDLKAAYSGSMLIINGRVYPQYAGSPAMGKPFAEMLNEYATKLSGVCNVYSCVAPLSSAFIPMEKYKKYNTGAQNTLNAIRSSLKAPAKFCDVFSALDKHFGELMYFGTDHHWNGKGAYYAYTSFCESAGIQPVPLESMKYERRRPFLGSLYDLTIDPEVAQHPDTLELFIPRVETKAYRYNATSLTSSAPTKVFGGSNNYVAFMSGDAPLIKITTNVKNGRRAAVVKNSMGNAFSVYLISHYEEIWVVDFRYSGHNLMEIILERGINDLIFSVGVYAAMSHGTINMMRNLAKPHAPALSGISGRKTAADSTNNKSSSGRDSSLIKKTFIDSTHNK